MSSTRPDYNNRLNKVRERMAVAELDALLVSEAHNIFYLCGSNGGYTGAKIALIINSSKAVLLIDSRYIEETRKTAEADMIDVWRSPAYEDLLQIVSRWGASKVGFESNHITVKQFERLTEDVAGNNEAKSVEEKSGNDSRTGMELVGTSGIIETVREIKDEIEIEKISAAAKIADRAFDYITGSISPGISEREIALELDYFMQKNGAEKPSFETIVASGPNSAVPHATPSIRKIENGDFVKLDFGAVIEGYHSDMTRTVVVGKASKRQREIYNAVKQAQEKALESIRPGLDCGNVDSIARDIIAEKGFGECFVHNLGHGVGLQIHESPSLGKNCETDLQPGMVVTVEPGIYVNGFGGVRIEDLVVVTETGHKVLSNSTKELIEL